MISKFKMGEIFEETSGQGNGEIDLEDRSDSLNIEFMIIIEPFQ